jgi:hypothetical protein
MLSVTGVLIWLKKARARRKSSKQSVPVRTRERTAS